MKALFLADLAEFKFTAKEKILYILIALFFITLYLPTMPVINNIFIALIFGFSFIFNSINDKISLLKQRKAVLLMILFYLLHLISAFFSVNKNEAVTLLGIRIPLLMFPIAFGLIYIRQELKERILLAYSLVTTIASIICSITALIKANHLHESAFLYNDSLSEAIGKQSIYFALMVNLSIFSYVYLLVINSKALAYKASVYLALFFLLIINFLLASRIAIADLYLSLLVFAVFYMIKKRKFLEGATLIMGLLIGCFLLLKFFPKTLNRFKELTYTDYKFSGHGMESHYNMALSADQWNGANIRLAVWTCGWQLAKQYPIFGAQLGDKKGKMMEIYREKQFDFALKTERNMHNNYLDVLCTFGIVGLTLFLIAYFFGPAIICYQTADFLGIFIIIAFAFSLFSETYLDRSIGCVLFTFFSSFIMSYKKNIVSPQ
jgi:O-antigen ligase